MTDAWATAGRTLCAMSHIGSVQCPIIVGRDDLLDLADRRVAEAAVGRGQLLLLAGEAAVEHILAKLAVTRRAEIAAWAAAVGRPVASRKAANGVELAAAVRSR
jgi:hypothetical protein